VAIEDVVAGLREELAKLEREFRVEIPKRIEHARELGDLRESGEYESAKDRQGFLHARIAFLQGRIAELQRIDLNAVPRDRIGFGSTVHLRDADNGEEKVYRLVAAEQVDTARGWISVASPIGRSLAGKQAGDEVKVQTPGGAKSFSITKLITIHDDLNGAGRA
jgi:transcription elongation factor GreA